MIIEKNVSLQPYNTFKIAVTADYFIRLSTVDDVASLVRSADYAKVSKKLFLGGGSNVLFVDDYNGMVIKNNLLGINFINEDSDHVWVKVMAGENWHNLVTWAVDHNYGGLENLALIPGSVGGATVQNIGAYGQTIMNTIESVEYVETETGKTVTINGSDCEFDYRTSIFKTKLAGKAIVTSTLFKLSKSPTLSTSYKSPSHTIENELKKITSKPYTVKDMYDVIIGIRSEKLPSATTVGTTGSFFKNPRISLKQVEFIQSKIADLRAYPTENSNLVKISAGRLLDELGWKNKWIGNVGTHEKLSLCVVTNGKATGQEVLHFVRLMKKDVLDNFQIELENEVVIIGGVL